jgi:hypothetical protein
LVYQKLGIAVFGNIYRWIELRTLILHLITGLSRLFESVSAYIETMESCEQYPGGRFKHDLKLSRAKVKVLSKMSILDPLDKFESYLEKIVRWGFFEFHCVPQVIYLTNNFGTPHPNVEIYRLSDLKPLEEKLGTTFGKGNPSENPGLKQELLSYIWNHDDVRLQIEKLYELDMMVWQS